MTGHGRVMNGKKLATLAIVATFVVQLVALGIAWGTMGTRVDRLEKDMDGMPEKLAVIEQKVDDIRDILRPSHRP